MGSRAYGERGARDGFGGNEKGGVRGSPAASARTTQPTTTASSRGKQSSTTCSLARASAHTMQRLKPWHAGRRPERHGGEGMAAAFTRRTRATRCPTTTTSARATRRSMGASRRRGWTSSPRGCQQAWSPAPKARGEGCGGWMREGKMVEERDQQEGRIRWRRRRRDE